MVFEKVYMINGVHHSNLFISLLFLPSPVRIMTAYCSPLLGTTCKITPLLLNPPNQRHASHGRELAHEQTMRDGMAM